MSWDWRTALLVQAWSDYLMFLRLGGIEDVRYSDRLHYLQMATEKLGKGLLSDGVTPPAKSHKAFQQFVQEAHRNEAVRIACGYAEDVEAFIKYLREIQPVAQRVENLVPKDISSPNPEYPWEERRLQEGQIVVQVEVPAEYKWPEWDLNLPGIANLLEFLDGCFRAVEQEVKKSLEADRQVLRRLKYTVNALRNHSRKKASDA